MRYIKLRGWLANYRQLNSRKWRVLVALAFTLLVVAAQGLASVQIANSEMNMTLREKVLADNAREVASNPYYRTLLNYD